MGCKRSEMDDLKHGLRILIKYFQFKVCTTE